MNSGAKPKSRVAPRRVNRRWFLRGVLLGLPAAICADAFLLEPRWPRLQRIRLSTSPPTVRFVHFTDLHHKGNRKFLEAVVRRINAQSPEFVCFTGDLIEDTRFLAGALDGLKQIKAPLYGVPGNHDYWSGADFGVIAQAFAATGGKWLMDEAITAVGGKVHLLGATCTKPIEPVLRAAARNVLLIHYPAEIDKLGRFKFDLALAGHSHGGQVRIPFFGPLVTPFGVGRYSLGLFQTLAGPLYVGAGIGWFYLNVRFNCRPEITVFEL